MTRDNEDAPDITSINLDAFINRVNTLSRSLMIRNALSLLH